MIKVIADGVSGILHSIDYKKENCNSGDWITVI